MRRHFLLAATAAITVVAGACSSGGPTRSTRAASAASTDQTSTSNDAKNKTNERMTPLSALFSGGRSEPTAADREAADEEFRRQEQLIADCMAEQGFQYIPQDGSARREAKVKNVEAFDLPPDQYAERWGYGISTIDASQFRAEAPEDPNSAIVAALSPAARSAYELALYGLDISGGGEPVIMSGGPGASAVARSKDAGVDSQPPDGCQHRALREIYGEDYAASEKAPAAEFVALNEEMGALWDRVANDPRVAEAKGAWGDCMADAGHPDVTDPDSPVQKVIDRFSALYGVEPDEFKQVRAGLKNPAVQPDAAALAEVQRYERSMAVADHRCRQAYDDVVFEVQTEVENRFIEEHRAELERYRDSIGLQARRRVGFAGGKG